MNILGISHLAPSTFGHYTSVAMLDDNSNLFENNRYNYVDVSPSKFKMKREFMAFKFDGKSYIRILNNDRISDITHGSFSMSAWFKPEFDPKIN